MSDDNEDEILYTVSRNDELGRFLLASRDIEEGEIIISEGSILSAPSDSWKDANVKRCLGCYMEMVDEQEFYRCSKCFFPCCNFECESLPQHANYECIVLNSNRVNFPPAHTYQVLNKSIMVLRALLLKTNDEETWSKLMSMENHLELRRTKPNCASNDEKVIENIRTYYQKHPTLMPKDDDIRIICGIIDVNAHLLPQRINGRSCDAGVCHIFLKTSLLSHSCVPNAAWAVSADSDSVLITRASMRIAKGNQICVSYDVGEILYGTLRRLIPMEITGLFICKCIRCIDPTELSTNLSTLICQQCTDGHVLPVSPTDSFSDWTCQTCFNRQTDEEILDLIEQLEQKIGFPKYNVLFSPKEESIEQLKAFQNKYSGIIFHPNHYILQEVKLRLVKQYALKLETMTEIDITNCFIPLCHQLLDLLNVVAPGTSEYKAIVQFHLCQGFNCLLNKDEELKKCSESQERLKHQTKQYGEMSLAYFRNNFGFNVFQAELQSILQGVLVMD